MSCLAASPRDLGDGTMVRIPRATGHRRQFEMACCMPCRSSSPAPQAEGTQGGQVPNGVERQGFFPEENAVFVTSGWVAKEGEKLIDNLFLGRILGAGMQVRSVQGASEHVVTSQACCCTVRSTPKNTALRSVPCTVERAPNQIRLCASVESQLIVDLHAIYVGGNTCGMEPLPGPASRHGGDQTGPTRLGSSQRISAAHILPVALASPLAPHPLVCLVCSTAS